MDLKPQKGTYLLIFKANKKFDCQVGKLGLFTGKPGIYCYVGSAQGPGGILARVKHHLKIASRPHWHLDYLRPYLTPVEVWYCYTSDSLEHHWARRLLALTHSPLPMAGFGASDCSCSAHLTYFKTISSTVFRKYVALIDSDKSRLYEIAQDPLDAW